MTSKNKTGGIHAILPVCDYSVVRIFTLSYISSPRISLPAYSSSPPAAGKHQAAGGVPTSQALHLSCCPISWPVTLLTLGLWLIGSIIIICAGRRLAGSHPTVRGFAPQLSAQNLYLMFDVQLPRSSERKFIPSLYIPKKQPTVSAKFRNLKNIFSA